jgi:hypothetical protein
LGSERQAESQGFGFGFLGRFVFQPLPFCSQQFNEAFWWLLDRGRDGKPNNIIQNIGDDDFVLATVVDFKSRWVEPFSPSETHPASGTWQTWSGQFGRHEGYLELPRFEISQQRNSKLVLEKMGLILPFSAFSTFIPLVGPEGAMLTRVQEGALMKVDETGAEIASYSVVGGVIGGICGNCPPPPPFSSHFD